MLGVSVPTPKLWQYKESGKWKDIGSHCGPSQDPVRDHGFMTRKHALFLHWKKTGENFCHDDVGHTQEPWDNFFFDNMIINFEQMTWRESSKDGWSARGPANALRFVEKTDRSP